MSCFDGEVINATGETLDKLLKDDLPVVIDFWAPWCSPCRNFAPIFEDVAEERSGKVRFVKVNTEAGTGTQRPFRYPQHPDDYDF
ncbi:thioredoxin 2 [Salmonella enterica subsp. enterica]|nr:thioredoxin 2 [Salmonella enterica subsp. enterica]